LDNIVNAPLVILSPFLFRRVPDPQEICEDCTLRGITDEWDEAVRWMEAVGERALERNKEQTRRMLAGELPKGQSLYRCR